LRSKGSQVREAEELLLLLLASCCTDWHVWHSNLAVEGPSPTARTFTSTSESLFVLFRDEPHR